jgi:uncharacterized coiled-coil DUF342 family protein
MNGRRILAVALTAVTLITASTVYAQDQPKPTKALYLRQVDQQLKDLSARIRRLRGKARSLQGDSRDRLSANVRMLAGKLQEVRNLREQVARSGSEWRDRKKELDAKLVHLRKSLTYVVNAQP